MASRILKSNYQFTYGTYEGNRILDLRYDPTNGNVELLEQGPFGQVLFRNGVWTDYGNSVVEDSELKIGQELVIANDVRAAAKTVKGKLQPWAQNQDNVQPPNPDRPSGQSTDNTGDQNGSGDETGTSTPAPNVTTFSSSSENFENEREETFNDTFLVYPRDISNSQDRITISQRFYKSVIGQTGSGNTLNINLNTLISERYTDPRNSKLLGTVTLPMPNDISETNVTAWGEDSLSTIAAMVGSRALSGVGDLAKGNFGGTIEEARKLLGEAFGGQPGAKEAIEQLLSLNAAASVTKMAGININPEAFRARITGTAINPNMELLFQGPKLRSFGFQFKMTPRSKEEAVNIRSIIKFFKKGMAPKRNANQPFFLGAPNVFDITFKSGNSEIKSIGKIKTCALQQCVVNYTPEGFYAAFNDPIVKSQPIAVTMQLTFTELTPLYNDNYLVDKDSVGYDDLQFKYSPSTSSGS
jgi:hypothetical protein